jgi:glycosyltransferase involved in cell wall biosynthesis
MRCWIVATYEPLPGVDPAARLLRCGTLAQELIAEGHAVTWWTSTFHHVRKQNRFESSRTVEVSPRFRLELLHAPPYHRNVSWRRIRHNRHMARVFAAAAVARSIERPDVIFAALPSLELAEQAVNFGRSHGIPVVVDARDKWPDLYLNAVPAALRGVARVVLASEFGRARRIFGGATGITAVSDTYLDWGLQYAARPRGVCDGVFPLGFPVPEVSEQDVERRITSLRQRHGLAPEALLFTFLGMFGSSYDLDTVISAARLLRLAGETRVLIVLAGTGELAPRLRASASDLPNVIFPGWLDQGDAWSLLRASSAGLAPYTRDALQSLPNKAFEYMAAGIPIVSSLPGELEALLLGERVGRQYRAGNPASLAEAMRWLAGNPEERRAMGERARAVYEERFSTPAIYPALVRHLQRMSEAAGAMAACSPAPPGEDVHE